MARILVVEDEEQVRVLTGSFLEHEGHTVLSAATPEQVFALLQREDVDVLVSDIGLFGDLHAGLNLAQQAVELRPNLKVLYMTGQAVTDGMKAMFVRDSALLTKPFTVEQLNACLAVHFGVRRAPRNAT
jgi:DNA-binding NtrC family response regulator